MKDSEQYDVVIVGAGISGAIVALEMGRAGKKVLILESGPAIPTNRNEYLDRFYHATAKTPESPYPPAPGSDPEPPDPTVENAPRATVLMLSAENWKNPSKSYLIQEGPLPFSSTFERVAGGTTWHWLGTSLRLFPNDFRLKTKYGQGFDWPLSFETLLPFYERAEEEIGVAADTAAQRKINAKMFPPGYEYPMPGIPSSVLDKSVRAAVEGMEFDGLPVFETPTPQGRNSSPYPSNEKRRVCAGNTNCIPICPIQAKYDATVTLNSALQTGNVVIRHQTVADKVLVDQDARLISGVHYLQYDDPKGPVTGQGTAVGKLYVLAAHAIEIPKLLLNSATKKCPDGVANSSGCVGRYLMDHPLYLCWALMPDGKPCYGYRGPLATGGIESLRDGPFRKERAAFRIEIGNEGWNFSEGDPYTSTLDFIDGTNNGGGNGKGQALFGTNLVNSLNNLFTRQFRLGFLIEQSPCPDNRVTLSSSETDRLGIPRPVIHYSLSDYTMNGFLAARRISELIFKRLGAQEFTRKVFTPAEQANTPTFFEYEGEQFKFFGSGHIVGTVKMGSESKTSVVDRDQRSWDHKNMFILGSGVFPTVATGNPTLTIAALAIMAAGTIGKELGVGGKS